jgi:glycosyltransferase involved in cell wall biosynthesis
MPSGTDTTILNWEKTYWNSTKVYLLRKDQADSNFRKLTGRIIDLYKVLNHIFESEKIDIIQARTNWICGLMCVFAKIKWKVPFVFQVSFPESGVLPGSGLRKLYGLFLKYMERFLVIQADLVFPISQWMQTRFEVEGIPKSKLVVLPMGIDTSINPREDIAQIIRKQYGLENCQVVIYFGDIGRARKLDFLLRVIARVAKDVPDVRLLVVGSSGEKGETDEWLKRIAVKLGVRDRVIFTGQVPRNEVPGFILASDVGVSPIVPLPCYLVSSPTKMVETLGMGRPVVGSDIPEQKMIINKSGGGLCTSYNEEAFAEAVVWLLQNPIEARAMGQEGKEYVRAYRSYYVLEQRVDQAYRNLLEFEQVQTAVSHTASGCSE